MVSATTPRRLLVINTMFHNNNNNNNNNNNVLPMYGSNKYVLNLESCDQIHVKRNDHMKAARLLIRVANNISKFPARKSLPAQVTLHSHYWGGSQIEELSITSHHFSVYK